MAHKKEEVLKAYEALVAACRAQEAVVDIIQKSGILDGFDNGWTGFYPSNDVTLKYLKESIDKKFSSTFNIDFSFYGKQCGSTDFEDSPLSCFGMIDSADEVNADVATEHLLEDFVELEDFYATLKDPLKYTIEAILNKWDKCSEFHEDETFVAICSFGEEHEYLVDIRITKVD